MSNIHKLFDLQSDIGRLMLEVIYFENYVWIVITESNRLAIDGGIQIGVTTPYSEDNKPTVINIAQDEHQVQKQYEQLCRNITKQLGCFAVVSVNTSELLSIADIRRVTEAIKGLAQSIRDNKTKENSKQSQGKVQEHIISNSLQSKVKNIRLQQ